MRDFKIRPLHRQRNRRRKPAQVLDHDELAELLGVSHDNVAQELARLGWGYHEDSNGRVWATPPKSR